MRYVLTTGPGHILGQVHVQPEKFNVELGRVLCLRPGRACSQPTGPGFRPYHAAESCESWRMKVSTGKVSYQCNQFTLRVTFVINEA